MIIFDKFWWCFTCSLIILLCIFEKLTEHTQKFRPRYATVSSSKTRNLIKFKMIMIDGDCNQIVTDCQWSLQQIVYPALAPAPAVFPSHFPPPSGAWPRPAQIRPSFSSWPRQASCPPRTRSTWRASCGRTGRTASCSRRGCSPSRWARRVCPCPALRGFLGTRKRDKG